MLNIHEIGNYETGGSIGRPIFDFYLDRKEYVPLVAMFTPPKKNWIHRSTPVLDAMLLGRDAIEINLNISQYIAKAKDFIDTFNTKNVRLHCTEAYRTQSSELDMLFNHNLTLIQLQISRLNDRFIVGNSTLFSYLGINCYCILMVKKEYVRYVQLCYLLKEPILENCLEFWYDEELVNTTESARLKRMINQKLKYFETVEIPILKKSNILGLLRASVDIQAPTLSAQKQMIQNFVRNFQESEIKRLNLASKLRSGIDAEVTAQILFMESIRNQPREVEMPF